MPTRKAIIGFIACLWGMAAAMLPLWGQLSSYGLGRSPTAGEIAAWDLSIGPEGKELPPGEGTALAGREVFSLRCSECHGTEGQGADKGDALVGGQGSLTRPRPAKTIGSYWPYATTIWDYVNRAMPFDRPGTLTRDQVYSVVAYLLYLNGIIGEEDVMNAATLPEVHMPNREAFVPDPRPDVD
ncbi:MAG: cytochrome c [Acidobacteriota bacterium]